MGKKLDLLGQRFGRLVVLEEVERRDNGGRVKWLCKCDCGKKVEVVGKDLKNGHTQSCGCLRQELLGNRSRKHGMSKTALYHVWDNMMSRCYRKSCSHYHNYGGRGITVCEEWARDRNSFFEWARHSGYKENLQLDRINNDGNYEPANCRFVTSQQNGRNTRWNKVIIYKGRSKCLAEWAEELGFSYDILKRRLLQGWEIERAFTSPVKELTSLKFRGKTKTKTEWAKEIGMSISTLQYRLTHRWSISDALTVPVGFKLKGRGIDASK